ncbi:MAG: class I poly(R)-hydroxyalkanoic acid synthase [Rhodocyclaceae bacterium]
MTHPQPREVFEQMVRTSQDMVVGFFEQLARMPVGEGGAATAHPLEGLVSPALAVDAKRMAQLQRDHLEQHARLWASVAARKPDEGAPEPLVKAAPGDRRFSSPEWAASPFYDYMRQAYLLNARFFAEVADAIPIADKAARHRLQFLTRQYIDALSPANFAATNPEFVQRALDTQGESITTGLLNLIADVERGRISMSDESAFEVGRNLATTAGSVVFQNQVMQLIQYAPLTERVAQVPLLIVPPCINKYYILDLQADNSFVRHAVEQGFTVFLVSWCNPKAAQAHLGWDDYVGEGVLRALEAVRDITKVDKPNILGFCVGGTLVASALAVARARGEDPVGSVTFLTTMLDFADTGDLACYVDETSVAAREAAIGQGGGLITGQEFSNVFSSLRPNDLVWNYVVDNYLRGNKPSAFDLLYWNGDSTNLPGPFAAWYLRNTYLENSLRVPGKLNVLGQAIDLGQIDCPAYFYASREDHIVPWKTSFLGLRLLGGREHTFVLGASGHIAGVINPPAKKKRSYWLNAPSATAEHWLEGASEHAGSWWPHWIDWLRARSGKDMAARARLGNRQYKQIEVAPGSYVREAA